MYKGASRNLQRAHRVDRPLPTGGYIGGASDSDDVIPSASHMSFTQAMAEKAQLQSELIRHEADLAAAKARGNKQEVARIGQVLQVLAKRLSPLKLRLHELRSQANDQTLKDAICEIVSPEIAQAIFDRALELRKNHLSAC